jgi:hypothetical protein
MSRTKQEKKQLAVLPQTRTQKFFIFRILIDKQTKFNEQLISVRDIVTTDKYLHFVFHSREFRHKKTLCEGKSQDRSSVIVIKE